MPPKLDQNKKRLRSLLVKKTWGSGSVNKRYGSVQNVTDPEYLLVVWIIIWINWRWKLSCLSHSSAGTLGKRIFTSSYCSYTAYLSNLTVLRNRPLLLTGTISVFLWLYAYIWAYSLESLMEGRNWFLNQFVEIPQEIYHGRLLISYGKRAGLNFPTFDLGCSWPPSRFTIYISGVLSRVCLIRNEAKHVFHNSLSVLSAGLLCSGYKRERVIFQVLWIRIGTSTDPGVFMMTKIWNNLQF